MSFCYLKEAWTDMQVPSGHLVPKWRRINVDATWWRRINVDPTSFSHQMPAGYMYIFFISSYLFKGLVLVQFYFRYRLRLYIQNRPISQKSMWHVSCRATYVAYV